MGDPETKERVSRVRRRNFLAKKLREDRRFSPRVFGRKKYKREDEKEQERMEKEEQWIEN